ncbi:MAG: alpha-amylase family glycosyl hydrolase [cyanobacterium endosymbiont of Rhopalodia musculus]|uniref:alpha-amylase family glycosyl hydrolase n=1 Tax=cyanobacterium endosymbiont of Epithemia clementina EcSB TaxID=3034674 RepID=UPI0024805645|nr:alpha-amylase family glycosyl hydrolase [cyanobacterium endosymbiont of Epithemia clementina EcSB]WGT67488.1 alpha-amylase family glycosyl hydrolase [cyanobacterium endosymbiont of Epithemia clementina EcSB]
MDLILDYLQDLGITALCFSPVFYSASNHRYYSHNYYTVAPLLGRNKAFEKLF